MKAESLAVRSVIDAVEAALRDQILDQEIPCGAAVREVEVARAFDVARPTAKAAIERLVLSGLLTRDVHRSARVLALSGADVSDLYLSRTILEAGIVRSLATRGGPPPRATATLEAMKALGADAPPKHYVEPDIEFHTALAAHVGSRRVSQMHAALMQQMQLCMAQVQVHHLLSPTIIVSEHERILAAISDGEPEEAARALEDHLTRARSLLVDFLLDESQASAAPAAGR
jgi:DNA-binding GntR family transcriptional regulator